MFSWNFFLWGFCDVIWFKSGICFGNIYFVEKKNVMLDVIWCFNVVIMF